jgi:hypothetical protein
VEPGALDRVAATLEDRWTWARSLGRIAIDRAAPATETGNLATRVPSARISNVLGRDTASATTELTRAGVSIARVAPYDELLRRGEPLLSVENLSASLRSGDRVELFTRGGEVAFFRRVKEPSTPAAGTPDRPETLTAPATGAEAGSLEAVRREIDELKISHAGDIAVRDAAIAELKTSHTAEVTARAKELAVVRQAADTSREAHETAIAELRAANASLEEKLAEADASLRRELTSTTETLRKEITQITDPTPPRPTRRTKK